MSKIINLIKSIDKPIKKNDVENCADYESLGKDESRSDFFTKIKNLLSHSDKDGDSQSDIRIVTAIAHLSRYVLEKKDEEILLTRNKKDKEILLIRIAAILFFLSFITISIFYYTNLTALSEKIADNIKLKEDNIIKSASIEGLTTSIAKNKKIKLFGGGSVVSYLRTNAVIGDNNNMNWIESFDLPSSRGIDVLASMFETDKEYIFAMVADTIDEDMVCKLLKPDIQEDTRDFYAIQIGVDTLQIILKKDDNKTTLIDSLWDKKRISIKDINDILDEMKQSKIDNFFATDTLSGTYSFWRKNFAKENFDIKNFEKIKKQYRYTNDPFSGQIHNQMLAIGTNNYNLNVTGDKFKRIIVTDKVGKPITRPLYIIGISPFTANSRNAKIFTDTLLKNFWIYIDLSLKKNKQNNLENFNKALKFENGNVKLEVSKMGNRCHINFSK